MVTVLRPLSTSELLDRTFHLYRNNFVVFAGIAALPALGVLVLQLGNAAMLAAQLLIGIGVTAVFIWAASLAAMGLSHAATVMAVSSLHLDRRVSIGSAYSATRGKWLRVIWISLAVILIPVLIAVPIAVVLAIVLGTLGGGVVGLGVVNTIRIASGLTALVALIVGLRWWLSWSLVIPVTVLEGGGLRASMRRSKTLTKGTRGRIFVIALLLIILGAIVSWIIQSPVLMIIGFRSLRNPAAVAPIMQAASAAGVFLSTCLVGPLLTIALTLVYYDQRVRKEGFDLQLMMSTIEGGGQGAQIAATAQP